MLPAIPQQFRGGGGAQSDGRGPGPAGGGGTMMPGLEGSRSGPPKYGSAKPRFPQGDEPIATIFSWSSSHCANLGVRSLCCWVVSRILLNADPPPRSVGQRPNLPRAESFRCRAKNIDTRSSNFHEKFEMVKRGALDFPLWVFFCDGLRGGSLIKLGGPHEEAVLFREDEGVQPANIFSSPAGSSRPAFLPRVE